MKNIVWMIKKTKALLLIYQIGFRNGLKSGEQPTANEYFEAWVRHKDWLEPLGMTDKDLDLLTGELRESGLKVLNINELKRQRVNNDD